MPVIVDLPIKEGLQAAYDALSVKGPRTIYLVTDTHRVYFDDALIGAYQTAAEVPYDNTGSTLQAENSQAAITELDVKINYNAIYVFDATVQSAPPNLPRNYTWHVDMLGPLNEDHQYRRYFYATVEDSQLDLVGSPNLARAVCSWVIDGKHVYWEYLTDGVVTNTVHQTDPTTFEVLLDTYRPISMEEVWYFGKNQADPFPETDNIRSIIDINVQGLNVMTGNTIYLTTEDKTLVGAINEVNQRALNTIATNDAPTVTGTLGNVKGTYLRSYCTIDEAGRILINDYDVLVSTDTATTISARHTFMLSPIVPTPVNATDAANKGYVDTSIANKANIFTYSGNDAFDPLAANLFMLSTGVNITVDPTVESFTFDYNDWVEYAWFDQLSETIYRTLIQWEYNDSADQYVLVATQQGGQEQRQIVVTYDPDTDSYVWDGAVRHIIPFDSVIGFKVAGVVSDNWYGALMLDGAPVENIDLELMYIIFKSVNFSVNDSVVDLYQYVEDHDEAIAELASGKVDKIPNLGTIPIVYAVDPTSGDISIQAISSLNPSTIAMRDTAGRMQAAAPTASADVANKLYVDAAVAAGSPYRGQFEYGAESASSFPTTGIIANSRAFEINTNTEYLWDGSAWQVEEVVVPANGYRYTILDYITTGTQAMLTYDGTLARWDISVSVGGADPDDITITIGSNAKLTIKTQGVGTAQLADGGITNAKIATGQNILNVLPDWNANTGDSVILNRPQDLVQDANYVHTDSNYTAAEKTKLGALPTNVQLTGLLDAKLDADDELASGRLSGMTVMEALTFLSNWLAGTQQTDITINAKEFNATTN